MFDPNSFDTVSLSPESLDFGVIGRAVRRVRQKIVATVQFLKSISTSPTQHMVNRNDRR